MLSQLAIKIHNASQFLHLLPIDELCFGTAALVTLVALCAALNPSR